MHRLFQAAQRLCAHHVLGTKDKRLLLTVAHFDVHVLLFLVDADTFNDGVQVNSGLVDSIDEDLLQ